ncbi:translation initiation factor IF-2-like [Molothrus ater]|uniref:translation initiation factor IF-2-like n=1 Tax=Molothrus ater TaxID=84834 RepID=UPI0023E873B6|nr:translation initiation factor IF-2-like [Molothrus ater]
MRISYLRTTADFAAAFGESNQHHHPPRRGRAARRFRIPRPALRLPRGTRGAGGTCGRRGARRGRPPRRRQPSVGPSVRPSVRPRERGERRWGGTRCWVTPARPRRRRRGASGCRGAAPAAAQPTRISGGRVTAKGPYKSICGAESPWQSPRVRTSGSALTPSAGAAPPAPRPAPRPHPAPPAPGEPGAPRPSRSGRSRHRPSFPPRSRLDLSFRRDGTPLWRRKPRCCCCCYRLYKSQCRPLILTAG